MFPDGRMETSWKIVPGAAWHDGSPLTTDDLLFTLEVKRDKELPFASNALFDFVETAAALTSEIDGLGRKLGCRGVQVRLRPDQRWLRRWFERHAYEIRAVTFAKPLERIASSRC